MTAPKRLAVIFDAVEERWPSMEYAAEMLLRRLQTEHSDQFTSTAVRPRFFRGFDAARRLSTRGAWNANRVVTRFLTYPWELRRTRGEFDFFHIADHTYAQLAFVLPKERTGIYCHDLDAFEPALAPGGHPWWRVAMAGLQLAGLRRAAWVFFSTEQIREQLLRRRVVDEGRLQHAPLGVAEEFFRPSGVHLPAVLRGVPYLLNVAVNFPRKRLDVLFRVFARLLPAHPELHLVQHGAALDREQEGLLRELGISDRVLRTPHLERATLAAVYQGARLVLLTSEREGFGFPAVEALACGAVVVLSDIAAFRETASDAGLYRPVGDVAGWAQLVHGLLEGSISPPPLEVRQARARGFTWSLHARAIADAYAKLREPA